MKAIGVKLTFQELGSADHFGASSCHLEPPDKDRNPINSHIFHVLD